MNKGDMDIFIAKEIFATRQKLQQHPMSLIMKPVGTDLLKYDSFTQKWMENTVYL